MPRIGCASEAGMFGSVSEYVGGYPRLASCSAGFVFGGRAESGQPGSSSCVVRARARPQGRARATSTTLRAAQAILRKNNKKNIQKKMHKKLYTTRFDVHNAITASRDADNKTKVLIMQNALFAAFSSQVARLTEKGATPSDINRVIKFASSPVCEFVLPVIDAGIVSGMTNQKAVMRLAQASNFIATGDVSAFDKGTALIVAALALTPKTEISLSDLHFIMGAKGDDSTVMLTGVSRSKLARVITLIDSVGTVTSQCSRTVGTGGFLTALGVVKSAGKTAFSVVNRAHPFVQAYALRLNNMTDGALALIAEK